MNEDKDIIEVQKVKDTTDNQEEKNEREKGKQENKEERKGYCIASMVLGIISIVSLCVWYVSAPCAILAIIFGILGLKSRLKGMAISGIITGALSLLFIIVFMVGAFMLGVTIGILENI